MKYYFKNQTIAQPADNDAAAAPAQPSDNNAPSSFIGEERALQIAFEHAVVQTEDVTYSHVKLENDDGRLIYEEKFFIIL